MLGVHKPISLSHEVGGWVIEEHAHRRQPFGCWHGDNVYYFTGTIEDARRFIDNYKASTTGRMTKAY